MSNDIKAGDMVMVVRPQPCGCVIGMYLTFFVEVILNEESECVCPLCKKSKAGMLVADGRDGYEGAAISSLIKIPPLSDLEDVSTQRQDLLPNEQEEVL